MSIEKNNQQIYVWAQWSFKIFIWSEMYWWVSKERKNLVKHLRRSFFVKTPFTVFAKIVHHRRLTGLQIHIWNNKSWQKKKSMRSSPLEVLLGKGSLKICSKFTGEHPCRSAISIKLQSSFIEVPLRHGFSPANLLHIFRTPFLESSSGGLLLKYY